MKRGGFMHKSVYHLFLSNAGRMGDRIFLRHKRDGRWKGVTWDEHAAAAEAVGLALVRLGVEAGRRVGVVSGSRVEWVFADMGIISVGCATTAGYPSSPARDIAYILAHSECPAVFVENAAQMRKIISELPNLPDIRKIIVFDPEGAPEHPMAVSFEDFLDFGREADEASAAERLRRIDALKPDDTVTIIYTSGTTGPPKGAMLSHANCVFIAETCSNLEFVKESDESLSFLPLAHALERVVFYASMAAGGVINFAESIEKLGDNMKETRPTVLVGVPRVYEKIHERVMANVAESSRFKQKMFYWAVGVGRRAFNLTSRGGRLPARTALKLAVADALVFKKIKAAAGGRIRWIGSGGAPLAPELQYFFCSVGMPLIQAYGLTETAAPAIITPVDAIRIGTVGKRIDGVDVEIAPDGEVIIRGPSVFKGYFKNEEATREAFDRDWFKSGDLGSFDSEGYLSITGRKKDLLITAGGKNISPQNLEHHFSGIPLVSQVVICGDGRKYLTALFTLAEEDLRRFAAERGLKEEAGTPLARRPEVDEFIARGVEEKNKELPPYETVKKFKIIPGEFTIESGEMTPTMKIKRNVIFARYSAEIESMYD